jgi:hypothetical protein
MVLLIVLPTEATCLMVLLIVLPIEAAALGFTAPLPTKLGKVLRTISPCRRAAFNHGDNSVLTAEGATDEGATDVGATDVGATDVGATDVGAVVVTARRLKAAAPIATTVASTSSAATLRTSMSTAPRRKLVWT